MNSKVLYDIFVTTGKHNLPDLGIGLAYYRYESALSFDEISDREIMTFIGSHYKELVKAYAKGFDAFDKAVKEAKIADAKKAEEAKKAE